MNLYCIDIMKKGVYQDPPHTHVIDLDYIVSISPIDTWNPISSHVVEATFYIYLKLGEPIKIGYDSEYHFNTDSFPKYILDKLVEEREKLIKAWGSRSCTMIPDWSTTERDCGAHIIPIDDYQRGRREGIRNCYDYLYKQIRY